MRKNPILVTGVHRSGSTWVGKMLNLSPYTYYIGEVLRPDTSLLDPNPVRHWYQYDDPERNRALHRGFKRLLAYNFSWPDRSPLHPNRLWLYRLTRRLFGFPRPLIKDPMAAMSSENLATTFKMQVICLVRHPAAFAASIRRAGWRFGFMNFLKQPELMRRWLSPFTPCIMARPHSILDEAALVWVCVYSVLHTYIQRNLHWHVWRHEDICLEPQSAFQTIYQQLDLPYEARINRRITTYIDPHNPLIASEPHAIMRNTRGLIDAWRSELSRAEIHRIRDIVEPISSHYYSDQDW